MSYIESLKSESVVNNASRVTYEIADIYRRDGRRVEKAFPIVSYLLYKVSSYNNPLSFSFDKLFEEELNLHTEVKQMIHDTLSHKLWDQLLKLTAKYSTDDFASAMLYGASYEGKDSESTPSSIINLANELLSVKDDHLVADICCGSGNFLISSAIKNPNASFDGYEIVSDRSASALMRADLLDANISIISGDIFSLDENYSHKKYDRIFSNYPFSMKLKNINTSRLSFETLNGELPEISKSTSSDWVFNLLICNMLKDTGKAVAIMTNGSTWNSYDTPMRKYFVENGLVETVISLPGKMFSFASIPTTLIVLSKNNKSVRMIDATELCHMGRRQNEFTKEDIQAVIEALHVDYEYSKTISIEELKNNEYILSLSRYSEEKIEFHNGVPFEAVIKDVTRGAPCTATQLDEMVADSPTNMQYLMLSNIQDGLIDDKLPYLSYIDPKYEKYCLKNNSLILSKNGFPYKIAVASVKDNQRILANGNLYIIELDETKANPYYIKAFFDSEQGMTVLKNISAGASMPTIGVDKLKRVEIPLPSLDEQEKISKKYQATLNEISSLKLRLQYMVDQLQHILDEN